MKTLSGEWDRDSLARLPERRPRRAGWSLVLAASSLSAVRNVGVVGVFFLEPMPGIPGIIGIPASFIFNCCLRLSSPTVTSDCLFRLSPPAVVSDLFLEEPLPTSLHTPLEPHLQPESRLF